MAFGNILSVTDISSSGLRAERKRMEVIANNIANANTTRTSDGGPFRRLQVVFSSVLESIRDGDDQLGGVEVLGLEPDMTELPRIYNPGHPDADQEGYVQMSNVSIPIEMVDLMTASRSYEANLRVLRSFRDMAEQALTLLNRT